VTAKLPAQVSAVSPLAGAIDGTPKAQPRRPRPAPVLREVTSGIVCFCGERFGEHQALEFMLHLRAEVGEHLEKLERWRESYRQSHRRLREDPEWRERDKAQKRAYTARPEVQAAQRAYRRTPEYRARQRAHNRARRQDPEYRARENAQKAEYRRRIRDEQATSPALPG
jgi:hypothetical protein